MNYDWDFNWVWNNQTVLLKGLFVTFLITVGTIGLGLVLSLFITILRVSKNKIFNIVAGIYIEIFRDVPVLVLLVWIFYCLPILLDSSLRISGIAASIIGLGLNFSALQAEIFRSGYLAIPTEQIKVAKSIGFNSKSILRHIIIPQTFWRSIPPSMGQITNTIKLTSLTAFIAVPEVFHTTEQLIQDSYRPLEFYTVLAVLYLIIIFPLSALFRFFENILANRYGF